MKKPRGSTVVALNSLALMAIRGMATAGRAEAAGEAAIGWSG